MKALSLLQPWATLIALGYKQYETRSWGTKHRGPLAIHASAGKPAWARQVCETDPIISELLKKHHLTFDNLPRGVVLGITTVDEVWPVEKLLRLRKLSATELACGDYSEKRHIWELGTFRESGYYPDCKGALSIWELPSEVEYRLRCSRCTEHLNPDAVSPCFCGYEEPEQPDEHLRYRPATVAPGDYMPI